MIEIAPAGGISEFREAIELDDHLSARQILGMARW